MGTNFPDGFDRLIDKNKTGKKQDKTDDGKPKMGLKDPVCKSDECQKLWAQLRDALESWYILQLNPRNDDKTIKDAKEALGSPNSKALGAIRDGHSARVKQKDSPYGDADKLAKFIKELLAKYEKCLKPCEEKKEGGGVTETGGDSGKTQQSPGFSGLPEVPETPNEFKQYEDWCKGITLPKCGNKDEVKKAVELQLKDVTEALNRLNTVAVKSAAAEKRSQPAAEACNAAKKAIEKFLKDDLPNLPPCEMKSLLPGYKDEGSFYIPGRALGPGQSFAVTLATDGTTWCTYTPGTAKLVRPTPADDEGNAITPSVPVSDAAPGAEKQTDGTPPILADKLPSDGSGVIIKDDPNWTWDPKEKVYVSKKDPKVKRPVPTSVKPGQMWDPEGDPDGTSPIESETSGNSRTYIDPKTKKIITRLYVDGEGHVYERDDNFDQNRNPQLVRVYDPISGELQRRETTDAQTGTLTKEYFDKDGKLTNVETSKDGKPIKRREYWPGTDKIKKVEENFDGNNNPGKTTEYPPPAKTATDTPPTDKPKTATTPTETPKPNTPTSTDIPTSIPDTVFVKAKESVLQGGPTGQPIQGQVVKLLPPEKPGLPGDGPTKTAQDTGFDKPPAQCTTAADGGCKIDVIKEDHPYYRLPASPDGSRKNYRIDVDVPKTTGGVVETTGKPTAPDTVSDIPQGTDIVSNTIKIGNRTFVRLTSEVAGNVSFSLREKYERPGSNYEEDYCRDKQPVPPLGMQPSSFSALNADLPGVSVRLDRTTRAKRAVR